MIKQNDNENYGITRVHYSKVAPGWRIRLNYSKGKYLFQETIKDSEYGGDEGKSLAAARRLRNWKLGELQAEGTLRNAKFQSGHRTTYAGSRSGVVGVSRLPDCWEVFWSDKSIGGTNHKKRFSDAKYERNSFASFEAAVKFRVRKEIDIYGYTHKNPFKLRKLYHKAMKYARNK